MTICSKCGSEVKDGVLFCTECGAKVESGASSVPEEVKVQPPTPQQAAPAPRQAAPAPQHVPPMQSQPMPPSAGAQRPMMPPPVQNKYNKPISTAEYFFSILLYSIPIVGLISMIIIGFTAKNRSRGNYAKAVFFWNILFLALAVILVGWYFIWGKETVNNFINTEITTRLKPMAPPA